jgi:hypothetical protein
MHSDDAHKHTWVGLDSRAKLAALFNSIYSNLHRDSNCTKEYVVALCFHLLQCYRPLKVSFAQNVRITLYYRIRISRPVAHACHGPTAHTSKLQVTPAQPLVHSQARSPKRLRPGGPWIIPLLANRPWPAAAMRLGCHCCHSTRILGVKGV